MYKLDLNATEDWIGRCWGVVEGIMKGGDSVAQLCEAWAISQDRLYRTILKDKNLKEGMTLARQIRAQRYADEALDLSRPTKEDWALDNFGRYSANAGLIQRDTLRINTLLKLAAKYDPELFGDRITTEHVGTERASIVIGDTKTAAAIIARAREQRLAAPKEAGTIDAPAQPAGKTSANEGKGKNHEQDAEKQR